MTADSPAVPLPEVLGAGSPLSSPDAHGGQPLSAATPIRRRVGRGGALALALLAAVLPLSANHTWVDFADPGGRDDAVAQSDLTTMGFDGSHPGTFSVRWSWDKITFSGANTGDACMLFDTDGDGNINNSLCVQIATVGATTTIVSGFPVLFSCGDARNDRCSTPASVPIGTTTCSVQQVAADPFAGGESFPLDMRAECAVPVSALAGTPIFTTVCSYPSAGNGGNNNPVDCVGAPGSIIADVQVTKTNGVSSVQSGSSTTYTLVVSNSGPNNANGTVVRDAAATGLSKTAVSCTATGGAVCPIGLTVSQLEAGVAIPTLPLNGSVSIGVTATVTAVSGTVTNTATVTGPSGSIDPNTTNNTAIDTDAVGAPPSTDLQITKTDGVTAVTAGSGVTYTITAANNGPNAVVGATVTDVLPGALTGAAWTCTASSGSSCPVAGTGGISAPVNLLVGGTATFTLTALVSPSASGSVANTASIAVPIGMVDSTPGNNTATDTNTIAATADLAVIKTSTPKPYVPGLSMSYTVVVSNAGPSAATGVRVQDPLPAALASFTWTCAAAAGSACGAASGAGSIDQLVSVAPGGTVTFTVSGRVPATSTAALVNTATVTPPAGVTDPTPGNNTSTDTNTAAPLADLAASKGSTPNPYVAGAPLTYTVIVSNVGPSAVVGASVTDTFPAALAGFTWTCTATSGACGTASGTGSIATTVDLPAGSSATFVITGTVPPGTTGQLDNAASIAPPAGVTDPAPGNNTALERNPAGPTADLTITKASSPSPYVPGATLTYTITASNAGPSDVTGARVQDALPAAIAGFTWTCAAAGAGATCGTASGGGDIDALVTLPAGTTATFVVSGTVPPGTTAALLNSVSITPPPGVTDPVPGNNSANDASIAGPRADLTAGKTSTPNPYVPGSPLTYTITVNNLGPSDVVGARIQDTLPPAASGFTWTCAAAGGASCDSASGAGSIDLLADLPAGSTVTVVATGVVPPSTTGTLTNAVTVAPPVGVVDPVPGNNLGTNTSGPAPEADLTASKSGTPNPYVPGAPLTYTIVVRNLGPSNVVGARVQDTFAPAVAAFSWTCTATAGGTCVTASGSGGIDTLVNLPVGAAATYVVTGTVPPPTVGALANTVTIAPPPGTVDPVPGNNPATATSAGSVTADLVIAKSSAPNPYVAGLPLTYNVTAKNLGPSDVTGARVQDVLPAPLTGFTWTCAAGAGAVCSSAAGNGSIDALVSLPAGASVTFTLAGIVPAGVTGVLANSASITAPPGVDDPVPGNNTAADANNATLQADLTITKSSTPDPYVPGQALTYTITVSNAGPSDAPNARVQDALPAPLNGFTWTCTASGAAACGTPSGAGNIDALVSLPSGTTALFSLTGTVPAGTTGVLVNTALVLPPAGVVDPAPGNNQATETSAASVVADLAVTKSSAPDPYTPGLPLTYTIVVSNAGPSDVVNARLQDALPPPAAGFTWTCTPTGAALCHTLTGAGSIDALVSMPAGTSATVLVTGTVPPSTTGPLVNSSTIAPPAGVLDPVPGNNQATDVNPTTVQADLSVTKTSSPNTFIPGLPLTYTIVVTNAGPSSAVNARVQDALPAPLSAFTWTCASALGTCGRPSGAGDIDALVSLPPAATATFALTGTAPAGNAGPIVNTASVTAPSGVTDPAPGNNSATDTNQPDVTADLSVSKSSTPNPYVPGQPLTYAVVVSNAGPSDVTNARVQDALPAALSSFTWTCGPSGGGTCATASGAGNVDAFVTLPAGTAVTFTVTGTVPSSTSGPLVNTATVTPPAGVRDPVPGDNTDGNTNPTGAVSDLSVTKTSTPNPYVAGQPLTYTLVVRNAGPSDAVGARVQDALPPSLAAFTWTCAAGGAGASCASASGAGSIDTTVTVPSGGAVTFVVTGIVPPGTSGSLVNVATVAPPAGTSDPVPGNNSDGNANPVTTLVDLLLTKTSTPNPYVPGQALTYTIVVSNAGPSTATNARVRDALPAALSGFTWTCAMGGGGICSTLSGSGDIDVLVTLPPSTSVTFTVSGAVPVVTTGTLTNVATVAPPLGVTDATPGNNSGVDVNQPAVTGGPTGAELCLLQAFPATAAAGGLITFTYTTINRGPGVATNLMIDGMLPAGVTYVSSTPSTGGSAAIVNGMFVTTWAGPTLPGQTRTVTITYRVDPTLAQGTIVSGWFMTSANEADPYHPNNMVDSYTYVGGSGPSADLVLQGQASANGLVAENVPVRVGQHAEWRLAVRNTGHVTATGVYALILDEVGTVQVIDGRVTSGWVGVSGPASGVWNTGPLAPGATAMLTLTVSPTTTGAQKLLAMRVDGSPSDPDATNDWIELSMDGIGGAPLSGRAVAVGNLDGGASGEIVTAAGRGETPQVQIYDAAGALVGGPYYAFDRTFLGGLRLAACDVDADGVAELVVGQASGGSQVRVIKWNGGVFTDMVTFQPFEPGFTGGVDVACADVDGNGRSEVVVGAGVGRAPDVRVFAVTHGAATSTASFQAYEPTFSGGVRVSAARFGGGVVGPFEVVTTPGAGRPVDLRAWHLAGASASAVVSVTVAAGGGAFTALGDADNDGVLDLAVMLDAGVPTLLNLFSLGAGQLLATVPGGSLGFTGGMQVAIGPVAAWAGNEIVTADGPGSLPRVQVFRLAPNGGGVQRLGFLALERP